eukprot:4658816-Amphidinium_carterae.1
MVASKQSFLSMCHRQLHISPLDTRSQAKAKSLKTECLLKKAALNVAANGHAPRQGAQKDVHAPRHSEWQRIVARPGTALRWQSD